VLNFLSPTADCRSRFGQISRWFHRYGIADALQSSAKLKNHEFCGK
jgi:hypothetical protein